MLRNNLKQFQWLPRAPRASTQHARDTHTSIIRLVPRFDSTLWLPKLAACWSSVCVSGLPPSPSYRALPAVPSRQASVRLQLDSRDQARRLPSCRPKIEKRPTFRPASLLLFARFRCWEQPILRETINALFLPSARPTFWGTPNNPRLPKKRGAVRLNLLRDVALQTIGLDTSILRYRDRSKHRGGHNNS